MEPFGESSGKTLYYVVWDNQYFLNCYISYDNIRLNRNRKRQLECNMDDENKKLRQHVITLQEEITKIEKINQEEIKKVNQLELKSTTDRIILKAHKLYRAEIVKIQKINQEIMKIMEKRHQEEMAKIEKRNQEDNAKIKSKVIDLMSMTS